MATKLKKKNIKIRKNTKSPIKKKKVVLASKNKISKKNIKINKKKTTNKKISLKKKKIVKKKTILKKDQVKPRLTKSLQNPIMSPRSYSWESKATFNPTAFKGEDKIHIIYRAVGEDDSSVLGYAYTYDGLNIDGRPSYHIYKRYFNYNENVPKIDYISGGGWSGGCEDPRIVLIDDTIYMIFTAFDGWGSVRLALTSISYTDFIKKKWNWKKAVMISPPGEINKNWVLFPERINGKYAILHSFYPEILINYFDSLDELDGKNFIKSNNTRPVDLNRTWDSWFRGVGPSPIKTKDGWLILYHAMDHKKPDRYRMGAILLDLKDPTKILYRSNTPILEPEEDYENNGHKWGVVYSCGAIVQKGELIVYYGGADKFVCVASMNLKELINDLKQNKQFKLIKKSKKEII
jgi:predicted GH43/DUF377 family glycosyl hydrolase